MRQPQVRMMTMRWWRRWEEKSGAPSSEPCCARRAASIDREEKDLHLIRISNRSLTAVEKDSHLIRPITATNEIEKRATNEVDMWCDEEPIRRSRLRFHRNSLLQVFCHVPRNGSALLLRAHGELDGVGHDTAHNSGYRSPSRNRFQRSESLPARDKTGIDRRGSVRATALRRWSPTYQSAQAAAPTPPCSTLMLAFSCSRRCHFLCRMPHAACGK